MIINSELFKLEDELVISTYLPASLFVLIINTITYYRTTYFCKQQQNTQICTCRNRQIYVCCKNAQSSRHLSRTGLSWVLLMSTWECWFEMITCVEQNFCPNQFVKDFVVVCLNWFVPYLVTIVSCCIFKD